MQIRTTVATLVSLGALVFSSGAFACGEGDQPEDEDEKEPSVLCGEGDQPEDEDEKEPSVLCGEGDQPEDEDEKEPSAR
jgi:hypothetical protein